MRCWEFALPILALGCAPEAGLERTTASTPSRDLQSEMAEIDACSYVGCLGPFYVADELDIGDISMGELVTALPSDVFCDRADLQNHGPAQICGFTREGVSYVLMNGRVIGKQIAVGDAPSLGLPLGLRAGQTPTETIEILREHTEALFNVATFPHGARYVGHHDVLKNSDDNPFLFTLLFVEDRLAVILLQDPSAPSD
jgi:hypothetical protein